MWKYSQWFIIFGSLLFGWPSSVRPSYREMSYSILHQHPMDRGQMREQFRGGCQSCLRLKILNMWIISMSTISQWATRGYSKFPILFPSYPSTFHIVEAKQLAKVSYLWHAATIHDAYALNSSKLVLNVKHNYRTFLLRNVVVLSSLFFYDAILFKFQKLFVHAPGPLSWSVHFLHPLSRNGRLKVIAGPC